MMSDEETRKGTVIAIPIDSGKHALSQVYFPGIVFYLMVFKVIDGFDYSSADLLGPPVIGAWTNDAEIYRGRWKVLGNNPVQARGFVEPEYRVIIDGYDTVESFDGKRRRPFEDAKDRRLVNRSSQSPLLVEDGVRAFFGAMEWKPYYEKFLICGATRQDSA